MRILFTFLLFLTVYSANADSPLTSTPFWEAYEQQKNVKKMKAESLGKKTMKYLASSNGDAVIKLAMINRLSWGNKEYVTQFEAYLISKRKGLTAAVFEQLRTPVEEEAPGETVETRMLTSDDLMCWAYLQAMGDYFNPTKAARAAYFALERNQKSMAYGTVFALIAAQIAFDQSWCNVYLIGNEYLNEMDYSEDVLSDRAVQIIMDYLGLYADSCEE